MKKIYDWKRYWIPSGEGEEKYSFYFPKINEDNKKELSELEDERCLILLGAAALGKSVCLEQEKDRLLNSGNCVLFKDLKNVSGEDWLNDVFNKLKELTEKNNKVYFLLDSFDEGQIPFQNLTNCFIERLQKADISKIYIRITCRIVTFPQHLISELNKINFFNQENNKNKNISDKFSEGELRKNENKEYEFLNTKIYKLLPLNKEDLDLALDEKGIDKKKFYNEIPVTVELKTPITALYVIDEYPDITKLSQYQIYENMCHKLTRECNQPINKQVLSDYERLNIASVIFTLMFFSNKYIVAYNEEPEKSNKDNILYLQKYFNGLKNVFDILKFSIPLGNMQEVLNTGLFTGNYNEISCIQKTYLEFLVAKFITENNLYSNVKNLIFDEYNKVLPFFINTACWLSEKNDSIFDEIFEKDPDILLTSIVRFSSKEKNERLLKKLFEIQNREIYGLDSFDKILKKLTPSKEFITNLAKIHLSGKNSLNTALAINMLLINKITDFKDEIFDIAVSEKYNFSCRMSALFFLQELCPKKINDLKSHINAFLSKDKYHGSSYAYLLINFLLPDNLSENDFRKLISQDLQSNFYYHIETEKIVQNYKLYKILLEKLIELFSSNNKNDQYGAEKLLKSLIEKLDTDDFEYFAYILYSVLNHHNLYFLQTILFNKINLLKNKIKFKILSCYYEKYSDKIEKQFLIHPNYFNFKFADLIFLIIQASKTTNKNYKNFLMTAIYNVLGITRLLNKVYHAKLLLKGINIALKNRKIKLHGYMLYNYADKIKVFFKKIRKFLNFIQRKRPIDNLKRILHKNVNDFEIENWNKAIFFLSNLQFDKDSSFEICPISFEYISSYWSLNKIEQSNLLELAKFYIANKKYNKEAANEYITTNSFKLYGDILITPAIFMVYKLDEPYLSSLILNTDLLKTALPYILNYPSDNIFYLESKELRLNLLAHLFKIDKNKFIDEILNIIDIKTLAADNVICLDFIDDLCKINDDDLNNALFSKIELFYDDKNYTQTKESLLCQLAKFLTLKKFNKCIDLFEKILLNENMPITSRVFIAKCMCDFGINFSEKIIPLLNCNDEFAKKFIENISQMSFYRGLKSSIDGEDLRLKITSEEFAKLYIIVENYFPSAEDTHPNGVVTPRDEVSDFKRILINTSIQDGDLAFFEYLIKNSNIRIEDFWIERAKRYRTEKLYKYTNIESVINLILNSKKRIIFNNKHLFETILEALKEIKTEIRKNYAYLRLWNECSENICYPKNEKALSDEIKRLLIDKLNNVIINREVEIKPKIAGKGSDIPDLLVECIDRENNKDSVVIEIKGCWNPDLRNSIKTQLLDKYLSDDNNYNYGIYLIGWYWCDKWDIEHKNMKRKNANNFSETDINETIDYFNKEAEKLTTEQKQIASFVIDVSIK